MRSALGEQLATAFTILSISRRMNLFRHRALAALAIGAVATSAALAVAVEVASRSVRVELARTASALVGTADLEVIASRRAVAESLLDVVRAVPGVLEASPIISETVRIVTEDSAGLPLHVLGVDLLAERKSFDFEVERKKAIVRDPLALLAKPHAILITEALAERLGLAIGDPLQVRGAIGPRALEVAGLIVDGDLGRAYRGQIAVMDVWALQQLVGAEGFVDRIDLVTDPELRAGLRERVQSAIGAGASVRDSTRSEGVIQAILGTLDAMLWGVPALGIVLASLLSHAAMSQLIRARVRRLALMQCVGLTPRGLYGLVLVDALVLSALGAGAGLIAGTLLSPTLVRAFSRLSEHIGEVEIGALSLAPSTLAVVAVLWLGVALTAAILPAHRVATRSPLEVLANGSTPEGVGRVRRRALAHVSLTALLALVLALAPRSVPALPRLAAIAGLGLFALLASGTDCLRQGVIASRSQLSRVPRIGGLLGLSILAKPVGSGTSMTAIAAVVALVIALLTVVQSTVASMDDWVAERFGDSAAVFAGVPNSGLGGESIVPEVIEIIRQTPGVDDVAILYTTSLPFAGSEIPAQAVSANALLRHGAFHPNDTPPAELTAALARGEVGISYAFSRRFGIDIGDSVVLPTRTGELAFRVGGLIRNYAGPTGTLLFDLPTFDAHFARDGATSLRFWSAEPYDAVETAIRMRIGERQPLFFRHGEEGRSTAARTLWRFRALLYLVVAIAALFCGAALLNLLSGSITSRRRDLAILQVAGARPGEIAAALVVDAAMLAVAGITCGTLLGFAAGRVLAQVLFERLGWFIDYRVDAWVVSVPVAVLVASCALIAIAARAKLAHDDPIAAVASGT